MRPASVFANPSDSQTQLLALLHGRHRVATRMIMILLSLQGWPPASIAALLGYHPATVRRPINRYNTEDLPALADRPRSGAPRLGSPRIGMRIRRLLCTPCAWTIGRIWRALGRPAMSLRTVHRRVREQARWRRPRLMAKEDPDAEAICAGIRATRAFLAEHPRLQVLHGARYSPRHNPVERIWAALKTCLANSPTATMAARIGQVHAFFRWSSPTQLLATAAPASSPWFPESYAQNFSRTA
jgi:transposase